MSSHPEGKCPYSLKDLTRINPFEVYEAMRAEGDVIWDEQTKAWLFMTATGCRKLMQQDMENLRFWTTSLGEAADDIQGRRSLKLLTGEQHHKLHRWWLKRLGSMELEQFRESGIRSIANMLVDRFAEHGCAELYSQYAEHLPVRAVCSVLGLPWQDDEWVGSIFETMKPIQQFFNYSMVGDEDIVNAARRATKKIESLLLPFIEERRSGTGTDLISRLWRDGPELLDDWSVKDIQTNSRHLLFAGSETTVSAISSALYLLMTEKGLADRVREGGEKALRNYVEEVLRLYGPVHYRGRITNREIDVAGTKIDKDEFVVAMQAAANRDPRKWSDPDRFDVQRDNRGHVGWGYGVHSCVGRVLAGLEADALLGAVVKHIERFEPAGEPEPWMTTIGHGPEKLPVRFFAA